MRRQGVISILLAGITGLSFLGLIGTAPAARSAPQSGVVGDGLPGSCTEAALDAALAGGGTITFNCGAAPKIITVSVTKVITANTTIDGGNLITLSGGNAVRVLKVNPGVAATLKNLALSAGLAQNDYGGGIRNSGTLIVDNCRIEHNNTTGSGSVAGGGGISNEGVLTVTNSIIANNRSVLGGGINTNGSTTILNTQIHDNVFDSAGGGVFIYYGGSVVISNSQIYSNTGFNISAYDGGGIYSVDRLTLINSSVYHNQSSDRGGGIFNQGTLTVTHSTISWNQAGKGAGLYHNSGQAQVINSTVDNNQASLLGGGLLDSTGALTVTQSTLNGNHANFGGGIYADTGASFLQNATLSNNSVSELGGGIFNHLSAVSLINVTVYGNSASAVSYFEQGGGGLYTLSTTIELKNTTVAGNTVGQNCAGHIAITSDGFNLADDGHCNLTGPGDQANVTAQLGPLQDNGGPTLTHLPLAGSLAIDHGTNAGCPAIDQRGAPRPFGAACDIGAVEYGSAPPLDRHVYLPLVLK